MKEVLKASEGLPNDYARTNVAFSPDELIILTGTSIEKDNSVGGLLCFYNRTKLEIVQKAEIFPPCSVVQHASHPRLNHVNDKKKNFLLKSDIKLFNKIQGGGHILYDPTQNERGARVIISCAWRMKYVDDYQPEQVIHNPHALPLFREWETHQAVNEKERKH